MFDTFFSFLRYFPDFVSILTHALKFHVNFKHAEILYQKKKWKWRYYSHFQVYLFLTYLRLFPTSFTCINWQVRYNDPEPYTGSARYVNKLISIDLPDQRTLCFSQGKIAASTSTFWLNEPKRVVCLPNVQPHPWKPALNPFTLH